MSAFYSFDYIIKILQRKKNQGKEILLLHGEIITLFSPLSSAYTVPIPNLRKLVFESDKPLILLAAPFVYAYSQQTIHLKKSDLVQADSQTLEFSRFPKENRILESIQLNKQKSITSYSHLSDSGTAILDQLKREKLKFTWKPAVSFMIHQFFKYQDTKLQTLQGLSLIMDQEMLQIGWKEDKNVLCDHLFYWSQFEKKSQPYKNAEMLLESKKLPPSIIPIRLIDSTPQNAATDIAIKKLFFPSGEANQVKLVKKHLKKKSLFKLRKIPLKYLLISLTILLLVWTVAVEVKLYNLKEYRSSLMKAVNSLQNSTAGLNQIAKKERSLIKISALIQTLQKTSFDPLKIINQLQPLLPKTSWIQSLKVDGDSIQLQILDSENSSVAETIRLLTGAFSDVRLDDNSILKIETHSLRKREFTINMASANDT